MNETTNPVESTQAPRDMFATTHWSVVVAAGNPKQSAMALDTLCRAYWYPLYAYIRRKGASHEDAEDLTQAFFVRFLEKSFLDGLDAEKGKFRAYLLAALKHFMCNEWDRSSRQKRGGGQPQLSLDWQGAETRYTIEPEDRLSPDKLYDRAWATALLEKVLARLREEHRAEGKVELFDKMKGFLMTGKGDIPYAGAAVEMNRSEGYVRVMVHRLRQRYRALLRDEIGQTLANPDSVQEEMQALFRAFSPV
jgi:RNA polymerase sigma-70 factor (ECF subfamily)